MKNIKCKRQELLMIQLAGHIFPLVANFFSLKALLTDGHTWEIHYTLKNKLAN